MRSLPFIALTTALLSSAPAFAEVKTEAMEYKQGDTVLQGFLAYDDAAKGKRPGVLVIHEWWGHNEHAREQAARLAKEGYVAFALDMYGKGKVATHPKDATAFMEEATKDPVVVAARFDAALEMLKKQPQVDPEKIAAIGYCFGGSIALRMARAGADLDAVVTFHAGVDSYGSPAQPGKVKAQILVNNGAADSMVPAKDIDAFKKEMKDAGVKATVINYPKAKHGFTNKMADSFKMDALGYNADADKKSFKAMLDFFKKVFAK